MLLSEIACGLCAQQPGEACINPDGTPFLINGMPDYHSDRKQMVLEMAEHFTDSLPISGGVILGTGLV